MSHELIPRAGSLAPPDEVARLLANEFAFVAVDADAGLQRARDMADWIERSPERIFLGRHQEAMATAARLKQLKRGEALVIEFGDDARRTLRVAVIPGESIKFGYGSAEEEQACRGLVERCARAPSCSRSCRRVCTASIWGKSGKPRSASGFLKWTRARCRQSPVTWSSSGSSGVSVAARPFGFHPAAEAELEEAAEWYEERNAGLGGDFIAAVRSRIEMILEAPGRWPMRNGTRRVLLGRFPYAIVYREVDDEVRSSPSHTSGAVRLTGRSVRSNRSPNRQFRAPSVARCRRPLRKIRVSRHLAASGYP